MLLLITDFNQDTGNKTCDHTAQEIWHCDSPFLFRFYWLTGLIYPVLDHFISFNGNLRSIIAPFFVF